MYERRQTRQIHVGKVPVGGNAPITVQSMTITKTADVEGTLQQIYALAAAGCDIVRCTCNETEAAEGLAQIVPRSPIPIIADIHHQYRMALAALEAGVHGLLQAVIEEGRSWRIESEGAVAVLLQLTLMFGPRFERSPDARWAQTLIANTTVPESLRMQMIRDRLAARTQGRSVVRHPASE